MRENAGDTVNKMFNKFLFTESLKIPVKLVLFVTTHFNRIRVIEVRDRCRKSD